eukprot:SAG11_NODE_472_length_9191_cov_5.863851_2_plen_36_part_00
MTRGAMAMHLSEHLYALAMHLSEHLDGRYRHVAIA